MPSVHKNMTILLVEDNPDDSALAELAFARGDLANTIEVVNSGQAALDYLSDPRNDLPVLVLLNLNLADMAGVDVIAAINNHKRAWAVPVIVLSGDRSGQAISAAAGAMGYLVKPLDVVDFLSAIRTAGLRWRVVQGDGVDD